MLIRNVFLNKITDQSVVGGVEKRQKLKSMAITVIALTTMFLFMSFPQTFTRGFFLTSLSSTPAGLTVIFFSDTLTFSFHALNFLTLYFSNKKYAKEMKLIFSCNKISDSASTGTDRTMNRSTTNKK